MRISFTFIANVMLYVRLSNISSGFYDPTN